ncbi:MAG: SDR family oxidoreductase [Alcaligenes faecalis]|jgi:short-subunit dehydrogenase|uniref:SDR family oxidoreductase n=1 Tax=Alcaligenes aquatilis TaxID=323284 RepID=A0ABY4NIM0_9BURK|nr:MULTISPECIES: SDR family oxidoreductase [Alcaligenes]MCH4225125.1 SDR family oxidoreductase [Alcaligenes faecalis]UQN36822.1 SDR family oxidoreductase [Alcaligenes aquatilis]UYY88150.1 SDR family oxidoreductase [Alcaligenes sp. SMD-FA]
MQTVFITGASSGLGKALAQEYAAQGACLGLLGRRQEELQALADSLPGEHRIYVADVRDRDALHLAAQDFLQFTGQKIDVVIASAGISAGTLTEEAEDFAVFKAIVDTNLLAMVATFEPFIGTMKAAGKGSLVGIASVAGIRGLPGAGAYSSSKAAVIAYCESLRLELSLYGVSVVTITPGYIRTAMTAHNPYSMPFLMPAEDFARKARKTIEQGVSYRVIPWQMGLVSRLMRLLPNWLYDRLARQAPRKPRLNKKS